MCYPTRPGPMPQIADLLTQSIRTLFDLDECRQQEALRHLVRYPQAAGATRSTYASTLAASEKDGFFVKTCAVAGTGKSASGAPSLAGTSESASGAPSLAASGAEEMKASSDERTTVKIKNLPRRCTRHEVLAAIQDVGFALDTFDFFYLPEERGPDGRLQTRGYALVNFVDAAKAASFRSAFCRYRIRAKNIETLMAPVQGLQANLHRHGRGHTGGRSPPVLDRADAPSESAT